MEVLKRKKFPSTSSVSQTTEGFQRVKPQKGKEKQVAGCILWNHLVRGHVESHNVVKVGKKQTDVVTVRITAEDKELADKAKWDVQVGQLLECRIKSIDVEKVRLIVG